MDIDKMIDSLQNDQHTVSQLILAQKAAEYWRNMSAKTLTEENVDLEQFKDVNPHFIAYVMYAAVASHMASVINGTSDLATKAMDKIKQDSLNDKLKEGLMSNYTETVEEGLK